MKVTELSNNNITQVIDQVKKTLKDGGLVVAPSDTVYGLLVDATSEKAVRRLLAFKNRPPGKAISVFLPGTSSIDRYVATGKTSRDLIKTFLPGPFTVVLPSKHQVSKLLESEKGTLGIRVPDYKFINDIVEPYGQPVTATSANISGRSPHYSLEGLLRQLPAGKKDLIDLAVDAGKLPHNKPSTVVDLTSSGLRILRHGDILFENKQTFQADTPSQMRKLGAFIAQKKLESTGDKPLIFIIEGDLGVGKTVFVKGIGELLGTDIISSPTFVVYFEYDVTKNIGDIKKFVHFDLYNIEEEEEFDYLQIEDYLVPHTFLCFEWGERLGSLYEKFKKKSTIVHIKMEYKDEKKRKITILDSL